MRMKMKQANTEPSLSEFIEAFLNRLDEVKPAYDWHFNNVGERDKESTDYLHSLELDGLGYAARAKLATKWKLNRTDRRKSKDMVVLLEPVMKFLEDEMNKKTINRLRNVLGEVRKQEETQKNRGYRKRVQEENNQL